uniref:HEAT repeat-containing protein 6 n=1 Tax=Lutzomyia longipalpis TaxID=7200 RepID=A0A1B0CTX9_LUTLO
MAAFPKIPSKEDTLVVKACCLMVSLVKKQNIRIPPHIANANIVWLLRCLEGNFHAVIHEAVKAFSALLLNNVNTLEIPYERFFSGDRGLFTKLLKNPKIVNNPDVKYEKNSEEEIFLSTLTCVDTILSGYAEVEAVTKIPNEYITNIGEIILRNIYRWELVTLGEVNYATFIYRSLNILKILTILQEMWIVENLGEILGAARAFTMTGYVDGDWMKPRRVAPSQQILVEPQNQTTSKGGKVIRAKKGKKLSKSSQKSGKKNKNPKNEDHSQFIKPYSYESTIENAFGDSSEEQAAFQTSESELSDSGGGKMSHDLRQKKYRVRLAAIQLIGALAKAVDRKTMFGYWHCLFAPNDAEPASVTLDGCILHDPSHRCRIAALQTISYLLHDAKKFLYQAESVDRESASFTPFSVALGKMVVQLYQVLLQALNTESLTPLIVQILKCFNILIPATPFHRLKSGIITKLVEKIRKLIHHWDATVKLHAFRVMGYIISITDITPEIMTCIGVERLTVRTENIHRKYLEDVGNEEDYEESVEVEADAEEVTEQKGSVNELGEKRMAWILEDLLSCISAGKERQRAPQVLEIHTECLTLLAAMSAHIGIMLGHLKPIAQAIRAGLESDASAIVVNSAKALDFIAHSITQYFLNASTVKATGELEDALMLWTVTLPAVTEHLQGTVTNVKVICCDALSNIGGHVYEKLPRDKQFLILSLLHGNTSNNETIVRASACRALSVLAQFPSLRDDLVFLENTAENGGQISYRWVMS